MEVINKKETFINGCEKETKSNNYMKYDPDLYYGYTESPHETERDTITSPQSPVLDEELEFRELDKSIEDIMDSFQRMSDSSSTDEKLPKFPTENKKVDLGGVELRNDSNTNTKYIPSYYSETDSGIGMQMPSYQLKRSSEFDSPRRSDYEARRSEFDSSRRSDYDARRFEFDTRRLDYESSLTRSSGALMAKNTMRSTNSFNLDDGRNSYLLRPNTPLDLDRYYQGRVTPDLKTVTIPLGTSDGKKVIKKRDTTAEEFLNSQHRPVDYDFSSRNSFAKSLRGSVEDFRFPRRPQWSNKAQFILACVGYSVGLGNIWRFPYVCYKSGGGAFLLPYFLTLVICGIPILYMELAVGQITKRGPIGALGKLCPLLKGAGLASVVISFIMSTYYNVIVAYTLYYFFSAFKAVAPWDRCDNIWNTLDCWMPSRLNENITKPNSSLTPSQEFYHNKVLQMTNGIEWMGNFRWELAACLVVAWIMIYFSIWKSVKSSGKVLYFTATLPYIIILAFLIRCLTLEGADEGLAFLFKPRWELLGSAKVWVNAAGQIFNSFGIAIGVIISLSSYNKSSNSILFDTLSVSLVNAVTSLLVGIFAFATIGNIAHEQRIPVEDVITDGPGLVFEVYPQALAKMPASQAWAILFFFMLLCIGLNSQFAIVEVVVTSIQDGFPNWMAKHFVNHEILVFVVCVVSFICGIPNIFQNGIYFFQLIDHYAASISIMYLAFFEVVAIAWFFGANRLHNQIKLITGENTSFYIRFCWWIAAPAFMLAIWIFGLIDYTPPAYNNGQYKYPKWAEGLGWAISSLSLVCIPVYAVFVIHSSEGKSIFEKLKNAIKPHMYDCEFCDKDNCEHMKSIACDKEEMDILLEEKVQPKIIPAVDINRSR